MSGQPLATILTRRQIQAFAGDLWFERGEDYFLEGRVTSLEGGQRKLSAIVEGTKDYRVRFWADEDDELGFSCSCPLGASLLFCKHCVAVAIAWIENTKEIKAAGRPTSSSRSGDLKVFLDNLTKNKLVEIVLQSAAENRGFRERLLLDAARLNSSGVDLKVFRKSISAAMRTDGFIDYRSASRYARRVDQIVDSIAALLDDGHANEVVALTEYALGKLEKVFGEIDDSDGNLGDISSNLQDLHLKACEIAKGDPVILAKRIFEWEMKSEWDFFSGAAMNYAGVLGKSGLAEYRRLAEVKWKQIPALEPGVDRNLRDSDRYRITSIMESLALQAGDHEMLVEIKSRDLSQSYAFLEIAEIYRKAKKHDKAVEWAEKGARTFPNVHSRLSDFLAEEYHRRGRHSEAMEISWSEFLERPCLDTYLKLRANALSSSKTDKVWTTWGNKALAHIRNVLEKQKHIARTGKRRDYWQHVFDHSLLVEIFLWEKKYDDAWQEATRGGCSDYLMLQVADAIASEYPERALPIYKKSIAPLIDRTNNSAYDDAIKLLRKLRKVMSALGQENDFDDYVIGLRVDYKRKRNFIKLLDALRK